MVWRCMLRRMHDWISSQRSPSYTAVKRERPRRISAVTCSEPIRLAGSYQRLQGHAGQP
jgi:hypothetical protein